MNNSELKGKEKEMQNNQSPENGKGEECAKEFISEMEKEFRTMETPLLVGKAYQTLDIPNATGKQLLMNNVEGIPKLITPVFHRVGLAALIGSSDGGKSSLLRDLCVSVVSGSKFLGWDISPIHQRAYYVSTEDDEMAVSFLLKKQNKDYGLNPDQLENLVYIFETDNLIERLEKELSENPADLVIIDAFADVFTGQLYETNRVRTFLNEYSQLAQRHQCLIIFLHHTNKRSDNSEPSKHNALGSQGFEAKMRLVIELKTNIQSASTKHLCIVKGNYLAHNYKTHSFDLQFTDNLTFNNLGTRTHYDVLCQKRETIEVVEADFEEIQELKDKGLTVEEIGLELGLSRATISRKITKYNKLKALKNNK